MNLLTHCSVAYAAVYGFTPTNFNDFLETLLEKAMAPHSSTLAWKIPWTERGAWWAAVHGVAKSRT